MTSHLNRLDKTVQMRGHNIWFQCEIRKNSIRDFHLSRALIYSLSGEESLPFSFSFSFFMVGSKLEGKIFLKGKNL